MEVEGVVAHSPGGGAVILAFSHLRGLAVDTGLHDVVLADGAVVDVHIPGPQGYCIPFLYLESFLCALFDHLYLSLEISKL